MRKLPLTKLSSLVCAGFFACAIAFPARLSFAEALFRRDNPQAIQLALWLDRGAAPDHYSMRLAELDPEHASEWIHSALRANPRFSSGWIALGLEAERQGLVLEARDDLLEAARLDRQYLPAWTLANFFFRQDASARNEFWVWARRSAELAYDDLRPLLRLAHLLDPDGVAAVERLGGSDRVARADLDYLVGVGSWDAAQQVARLLLRRDSPADRPRLLALVDRQIDAGNASYALELWNRLLPSLDPESDHVLTNGNLEDPPGGLGFDWRLISVSGVEVEWKPALLSFLFSGTQTDAAVVLEQIIPLPGRGSRYGLSFEYRSTGLPSPPGIRWAWDGEQSSWLAPSSEWTEGQVLFSHRSRNLARLRLLYGRKPGTQRSAGRLELRRLSLKPGRP